MIAMNMKVAMDAPPPDSSVALITSEGQTLLAKLPPKSLTAETTVTTNKIRRVSCISTEF